MTPNVALARPAAARAQARARTVTVMVVPARVPTQTAAGWNNHDGHGDPGPAYPGLNPGEFSSSGRMYFIDNHAKYHMSIICFGNHFRGKSQTRTLGP